MTPRAHPRYELRLSAEIRSEDRVFTGVTRNLSVGGCCVEAAYPLREDADIAVGLFLVVEDIEDERMPPLETRARVQWAAETDAGEHAAGIQFTALSPEQQGWLESFLARIGQD